MIETYTDGFFYHPDGAKLPSIVERIATGRANPRLDDGFAIAVQETKDEKRANATRANRLLARIDEINAELARLEKAQEALDDRLERQHALSRYINRVARSTKNCSRRSVSIWSAGNGKQTRKRSSKQ